MPQGDGEVVGMGKGKSYETGHGIQINNSRL